MKIKFIKQSNFIPPTKRTPKNNPRLQWGYDWGTSKRVRDMTIPELQDALSFTRERPIVSSWLGITNLRWIEVFTAEIEYRGTYAQHES